VLKILQLTTIFFARWYKLSGSRSVPHSGSSNPNSGSSNPHSGSSNPHSGSSNPHSGSSNPHSGSSNPPATQSSIPVEIKAGQGVELSLDNFQVKLLCFNFRLIYPKFYSLVSSTSYDIVNAAKNVSCKDDIGFLRCSEWPSHVQPQMGEGFAG
jgi:hypothetical protein